jgi:hypothetical protein
MKQSKGHKFCALHRSAICLLLFPPKEKKKDKTKLNS